jgi:hypothetical protein
LILKACLNGSRRPDFASDDWHETGASELAEELLRRGIGVEAGLWTPHAAELVAAARDLITRATATT